MYRRPPSLRKKSGEETIFSEGAGTSVDRLGPENGYGF